MQFLAEYGLFLAKALTVVAGALIVVGALAAVTARQKKATQSHLEVTLLNKRYEQMERALRGALLPPREFKRELKAKKKADKAKAKADKRAGKVGDGDGGLSRHPRSPLSGGGDGDGKSTVAGDGVGDGDGAGDAGGGAGDAGAVTVDGDKKPATGDAETVITKTDGTPKPAVSDGDKAKSDAGDGSLSRHPRSPLSGGGDGDKSSPSKRIFVLNFDGDIRASAVSSLCQEVSAILTMAGPADEVVVRVESGGGVVHGYGLAASQLARLRERGIPLTVAVDKIAASGGYMMACVADKIIAAPFAFIGSIGVLLQSPNLRGLLKKHDVEFEQIYAGEHKRTLTLFGENTDKAREKVQQQIEETHTLFKAHVKAQRPGVDIEQVATGEYWLGSRALEMGLVDQLQTSDDYLMAARGDAQILELHYAEKQKLIDKFASMMRAALPGMSFNRAPVDGLDRPMAL